MHKLADVIALVKQGRRLQVLFWGGGEEGCTCNASPGVSELVSKEEQLCPNCMERLCPVTH